ncbi:MAG: glycerophosphodiester phosphodiesterase [Anaerolineales bacterium]|nr:glycerophosphodiester phosphodiesterase [Anaerolineales bacterium]
MTHFEIVAHRGIHSEAPENTIAAFQRALEWGADAVEMDIRLTADRIPVVYHYYYLQVVTNSMGAIFDYSLEQLRGVEVICPQKPDAPAGRISTLAEILDLFGGKIGLELEIKGPEPEAPEIIGGLLNRYKPFWPTIEVTSFEPALLLAVSAVCPGLAADLLLEKSEAWEQPDVVAYQAVHRGRLAGARAVHLHTTQLSENIVAVLRRAGMEVHAWDVNDGKALEQAARLGIPRICTDRFKMAYAHRTNLADGSQR